MVNYCEKRRKKILPERVKNTKYDLRKKRAKPSNDHSLSLYQHCKK